MNIVTVREFVMRLFLWGGLVLLALAVIEKSANLLGQTVTWITTLPSVLASYGALCAIFAIALLLVDIRMEMRETRASRG